MDGRTDGWTDGPTDKASYRVVCPQLKRETCEFEQTLQWTFSNEGNDGIRDKKRDMWIRRNIVMDILRNVWNLRKRQRKRIIMG